MIAAFRIKKWLAFLFILCVMTAPAFAAADAIGEQKAASLQKITGNFSFVVLGDNRSGDNVYKKLLEKAMELKPDFVVNTGDVIKNCGNRDQWKTFWELSKPVAAPYFQTAGNHEVCDAKSEELYREQVHLPGNELYYPFVAGGSLFIVLDSSLAGQKRAIDGEQLEWLRALLASSPQRLKFIFVHHPLYPDKEKGRHYGNSLDKDPEKRDRLQELFIKHGVTAVFTGHEHLYLRKKVGGITHIITGGGGAPLYAEEKEGGFYHFIRVTVDKERVKAEVLDLNGKVRDSFGL